ncbi:hypothetical protein H0N99_01920 [Candidatus Micrarchaeota archaeon]|nr:hypothetical protein [Candidatus Micrarchaeota archaeon]
MRARTKIYNKVAGESRNRKLRNVLLGLILLSFILTISLWMIIEMMNEISMLQGSPWKEIRSGEMPHLLVLFIISFSSSTLYIFYYKGVREISKTAPRYLLAIAILVLLARVLFSF